MGHHRRPAGISFEFHLVVICLRQSILEHRLSSGPQTCYVAQVPLSPWHFFLHLGFKVCATALSCGCSWLQARAPPFGTRFCLFVCFVLWLQWTQGSLSFGGTASRALGRHKTCPPFLGSQSYFHICQQHRMAPLMPARSPQVQSKLPRSSQPSGYFSLPLCPRRLLPTLEEHQMCGRGNKSLFSKVVHLPITISTSESAEEQSAFGPLSSWASQPF